MARDSWNDWNPMKLLKKKHLYPGSRVLGSWLDLWHFSQNLVSVKDRIELEVKEGCKRYKLQQK